MWHGLKLLFFVPYAKCALYHRLLLALLMAGWCALHAPGEAGTSSRLASRGARALCALHQR